MSRVHRSTKDESNAARRDSIQWGGGGGKKLASERERMGFVPEDNRKKGVEEKIEKREGGGRSMAIFHSLSLGAHQYALSPPTHDRRAFLSPGIYRRSETEKIFFLRRARELNYLQPRLNTENRFKRAICSSSRLNRGNQSARGIWYPTHAPSRKMCPTNYFWFFPRVKLSSAPCLFLTVIELIVNRSSRIILVS